MSYNIDTWETLRLENLILPVKMFDENDIRWARDNAVSVKPCEDGAIEGVIKGDEIHVSAIRLRGSGSSRAYEQLLEGLAQSTGILDAVMIWEGGDSISRLIVKGGAVEQTGINIVEVMLDELRKKANIE